MQVKVLAISLDTIISLLICSTAFRIKLPIRKSSCVAQTKNIRTMTERNAINSAVLVISQYCTFLISHSHIVMPCFLVTDIRKQIIDLNVNDYCTGAWNQRSIHYKKHSPHCIERWVGNKNFTPAVTLCKGVNQNLRDLVFVNYYNIDYPDYVTFQQHVHCNK